MSFSLCSKRIISFKNTFTRASSSSSFDFHEKVNIKLSSVKDINLHNVWLRHHCQCETCFNSKTYQRIIIPSQLPSCSLVKNVETCLKSKTTSITWADEHKSLFKMDWLEKVVEKMGKIKGFELENSNNYNNYDYSSSLIPLEFPKDPLKTAVSYDEFMSCNNGVRQLLENVVKYGFGIVQDAPENFNETKNVVKRISHPQNTIYGDFSEWTSNLEHADTAYTSDFVHLHTDTSYFSEPMGLQMFHCLKHDGNGGVNSLVDGFGIAKKFYESFRSEHSILSKVLVPSQYLDVGKHHFYSVDTTFKHNSLTNTIERFRYNPHDMATLDTVPLDLIGHFYQSLVKLSNEIESSPTWLKLSPGIIIFLDNWRVLHGRSKFTGFRHLCGAYISRSDWLSKARILGII